MHRVLIFLIYLFFNVFVFQIRGVGMCGYYRVPGEPTKEEPEDSKEKKKTVKTEEVTQFKNSSHNESDKRSDKQLVFKT